ITAEGAVRDKRLRSLAAQKRSQFLRLRAAIRKHQPLFAPMQTRDDVRRIRNAAAVIDENVGIRRRLRRWNHYLGGPVGFRAKPLQQPLRFSHRRGEADSLCVDAGYPPDSIQNVEKMPAAVIGSEGV